MARSTPDVSHPLRSRWLALLAVVLVVGGLAACGDDDGDGADGGGLGGNGAVDDGGDDGDGVDGAAVFSANCASCHGESGQGGNVGPSLEGVDDVATIENQVRNGGGGMPAFEGDLSDEEIDAVTDYVSQEIASG